MASFLITVLLLSARQHTRCISFPVSSITPWYRQRHFVTLLTSLAMKDSCLNMLRLSQELIADYFKTHGGGAYTPQRILSGKVNMSLSYCQDFESFQDHYELISSSRQLCLLVGSLLEIIIHLDPLLFDTSQPFVSHLVRHLVFQGLFLVFLLPTAGWRALLLLVHNQPRP